MLAESNIKWNMNKFWSHYSNLKLSLQKNFWELITTRWNYLIFQKYMSMNYLHAEFCIKAFETGKIPAPNYQPVSAVNTALPCRMILTVWELSYSMFASNHDYRMVMAAIHGYQHGSNSTSVWPPKWPSSHEYERLCWKSKNFNPEIL